MIAFFPKDQASIASSADLPIPISPACTQIRGRADELRRLAESPDPGPGVGPRCQSSGVTLRRAVLKVGGGELERLLNVVRLQFGIVPEEVVPVRILRHGLHHSTNRQPHATDARLAVHLVGVPGYAIKELHPSYSDTFRVPSRRRHRCRETPLTAAGKRESQWFRQKQAFRTCRALEI